MSKIDAELPSDDDIQSVGSSIAESVGSEVQDEDDLEEDLEYESGGGEEEAQSEEDFEYESGEEEAKSGPLVPTPTSALGGQGGSSLEVGMQVEALFDGGDDYYPGKITRKGLNGKFDVLYHDGDSEVDVPASMIRPVRQTTTMSAIPESSSISVESSMQDDVEDIKSSIHSSGNEEYEDDDYDDDFEKSSSVTSSSLKMQPKTAKAAAASSLPPKKAVTNKIRAIGNQASPHDDLYAESSTESFHHLQKDNAEKQVEVMAQMLKQQHKQVSPPTNNRVFHVSKTIMYFMFQKPMYHHFFYSWLRC